MTRQTTTNLQSESILNRVHEGMDVYTSDDNHIGEVESVYFGAVSEQQAATGTGPVTDDDPRMQQRSWVEELADVFRTDEIPEEMRASLPASWLHPHRQHRSLHQ
ncbi:MAG: PRC-barrel domain-containing protein [Caldilineaceae bacterium]